MTLDEAIKHCEEVAEKMNDCECAEAHRQLAKWLLELKESRKIIDIFSKIIIKVHLSDTFKRIQYLRKLQEDENSKK